MYRTLLLTSLEKYSVGTMSTGTKLVSIFLLVCLLSSGESLIHDGFHQVFGTPGSATSLRTTRLLNQLCSESQPQDSLKRDACYGCFFRASFQPSGYPTLLSMATCADSYLNNTDYGHCRGYLRNATRAVDPRIGPTVTYCTFLECIRQVNKDSLEALESLSREAAPWSTETKVISRKISQLLAMRTYLFALRGICIVRLCVGEGLRMFSNFSLSDVKLAQLFVNTTACILAKTRCAVTNPITGAYQKGADLSSKLGVPSTNALFVNSYYDINIIQLPFGSGMIDECAKFRNAQQANWPTVKCINPPGY